MNKFYIVIIQQIFLISQIIWIKFYRSFLQKVSNLQDYIFKNISGSIFSASITIGINSQKMKIFRYNSQNLLKRSFNRSFNVKGEAENQRFIIKDEAKLSNVYNNNSQYLTNSREKMLSESEITKQLSNEILSINRCLQQYELRKSNSRKLQSRKNIRTEIFTLENNIKSKDQMIRKITEEIRALINKKNKNTQITDKFNKEETIDSKKIECEYYLQKQNYIKNDSLKLPKFLKYEKQLLVQLIAEQQRKTKNLERICEMTRKIQKSFLNNCIKTKQKPLSYQQFKLIKLRKIQQLQMSRDNFGNSLSNLSRVDKKNSGIIHNKTLKQLQSKKYITQQALKSGIKKHSDKMNELRAKVQFLRDEEMDIDLKMKQKQQEQNQLQEKFNSSGNHIIPINRHNRVQPLKSHYSSPLHRLPSLSLSICSTGDKTNSTFQSLKNKSVINQPLTRKLLKAKSVKIINNKPIQNNHPIAEYYK